MIRIAHLYYDLMNLYGESGNIKALKNWFDSQNIKIKIDAFTLNNKIDFKKYDLVYIGSGTESNQKIVLEDILKYQKDIKEYIEDCGFFLATGNSIELFGKKIIDINSNEFAALDIFDFTTIEQSQRIVCETIAKCSFLKKDIIGFQNRSGIINSNEDNLFTIKCGIGNNHENKNEGVHYKNFFGTYLIGPILVRNPIFLQYIAKGLIKKKIGEFKFKKVDFTFENKAYEKYLEINK